MRKTLISFFSCILLSTAFIQGQGMNNLWLMGDKSALGIPFGGTNIDFISGTPNIYYVNRPMNIRTTNSAVSDNNGALLFYSNGVYVADATNDTMINGSGLNPSQFTTSNYSKGLTITQGNLIIPFPGDSTKYYLFHETVEHSNAIQPLHLFYSIIDMKLNNGLGAVTSKNVTVISDTLTIGELTSCKHANGRDWWVIVHKYKSKRFYKLLITPNGIQVFTQNIGTKRNAWGGQSVFSPNGNHFAHYNPNTDLDIYDFDRCTGQLSNFRHVDINDNMAGGGIAFAPNSNILYVSSILYIYQFDASVSNISSTQMTVAVWDTFYSPIPPFATNFFLSQLAPDGKIYVNTGNGTDYLHVINNPDSIGLGCDVCQHCVQLPTYNNFTIANHPNYHLGPLVGSPCDTLLTGMPPTNVTLALNLYPNPNRGSFQITYTPVPENLKLQVFNILGKEVHSQFLPQWSQLQNISISNLGAGVYFAILSSSVSSKSIKFVVETTP